MAEDRWQYPKPRRGFGGAVDRLLGPGTTRAEFALILGTATAAGVALLVYALTMEVEWNTAQYALAIYFVVDLSAGVVANATTAAKRWYHRQEQGFVQHFGFVATHVPYPLLVAWFFRDGDWAYFLAVYGYLLLAALIVLRIPLYLRRPVAYLLLGGALVINSYIFLPTPGLEWFVPLLFLKLIVSHLLREEPYPPGAKA